MWVNEKKTKRRRQGLSSDSNFMNHLMIIWERKKLIDSNSFSSIAIFFTLEKKLFDMTIFFF